MEGFSQGRALTIRARVVTVRDTHALELVHATRSTLAFFRVTPFIWSSLECTRAFGWRALRAHRHHLGNSGHLALASFATKSHFPLKG